MEKQIPEERGKKGRGKKRKGRRGELAMKSERDNKKRKGQKGGKGRGWTITEETGIAMGMGEGRREGI